MKTFLFTFLACILTCSSYAQEQGTKYFFREIGWTITIPARFKSLSRDSFKRIEQRGRTAIGKTVGEEVDFGDHKKLFVVREGQADYMDATIEPFDTVKDGNWIAANDALQHILTETFVQQMPNARIDTTSSVFTKDGIIFRQFYIKMQMPNGLYMHMYMFSTLLKGYDFGCTMLFIDEEKGRAFYDAWEKSRFTGQ